MHDITRARQSGRSCMLSLLTKSEYEETLNEGRGRRWRLFTVLLGKGQLVLPRERKKGKDGGRQTGGQKLRVAYTWSRRVEKKNEKKMERKRQSMDSPKKKRMTNGKFWPSLCFSTKWFSSHDCFISLFSSLVFLDTSQFVFQLSVLCRHPRISQQRLLLSFVLPLLLSVSWLDLDYCMGCQVFNLLFHFQHCLSLYTLYNSHFKPV